MPMNYNDPTSMNKAGMSPAATKVSGSGIDPNIQNAYGSPQVFSDNPPGTTSPSNGVYSPGMEDQESQTKTSQPDNSLRAMMESVNIAEHLDSDKCRKIGERCRAGFEQDLESRQEWEDNIDEWTKLAIQTKEQKTYPWPKASNIKFPLLSTAAMQFAARAYPSLIPSDGRVVKSKVIGKDPTGEKQKKAENTSIFVSYQLMDEMENWEEDMDKLLIMLPVVGTMFKKTYWDPLTKKNCSKLILPKNLVVNYWAKSLEHVERISEIIQMSERLYRERVNAGIFCDTEIGAPTQPDATDTDDRMMPAQDCTTPYEFIEQHCFLDLDEDGYEEPYVVTFHRQSGTVLRISTRFDNSGIEIKNDKIVRIEPIQYYTKFGFIPNPDGSFYDIGFGMLLGPLNDSVNTIINQLVDAGTLSNLQSGFIGKGLRLKMGETRFQPGEWKAVNATADDLKKQIFPMPVREPSNVLFQLMGTLVTSAKELASVAEIFVGKMPGQNTPATTTMATIEQGMKVFTAVYKRIYRSLASEYKKLYKLNATYLNPQTYSEILDTNVNPEDFNNVGYDICPGADPSAISQTERLLKAQGLVEMLPMGVLDPVKVIQRVLEAQEQPNWQELLHPAVQQTGQPPQQPDPKAQELQMKAQAQEQASSLKQQEMAFQSQLDQRDQQFKHAMEVQRQEFEMRLESAKAEAQSAAEIHKTRSQIVQSQAQHQQQQVHAEQNHQQTMKHKAAQAQAAIHQKSSAKKTSK